MTKTFKQFPGAVPEELRDEDPNESDVFEVEFRSGWGKKIAEQKKQDARHAKIKFHEDKLVAEVKRHNDELRRWIKWSGVIVVSLLLAITTFGIQKGSLRIWLLVLVFAGAYLFYTKYENLKKKGFITCKNCSEEFVPRENDLDKKCPYCEQGHSATYL